MLVMETKKIYLEYLRIVASFLVIVNHTNSLVFLSRAPSCTWFLSITWFFICKIAVPLFLMISGALLLQRQDTFRKTVSRFFRVFVVFFVCSAGCYIFFQWNSTEESSALLFLAKFFSGSPVSNAYWYFYLYLGLLLTMPLLQRMAAALSQKGVLWLILLSVGIRGVLPLIEIFTKHPANFFWEGGLFSTYIGLLFAGYYIDRYMKLEHRHFWIALTVFIVLVAFEVIYTYFLYLEDAEEYLYLDNRTLLPITASSACAFLMVKHLLSWKQPSPAAEKKISQIGGLTFGIYLLSDPAIRATRGFYSYLSGRVNAFAAVVVWEVILYLFCGLVIVVIRMIPGVKKWI